MVSAVRSPLQRFGRTRGDVLSKVVTVAAGLGAIALSLVVTQRLPPESLFVTAALALLVVLPAWLIVSSRYAVTLCVLGVYLGLVDGVLKLTVNTPAAALGRDLVLYSIVFGAVVRLLAARRPLRLPPLTGGVAAFVVIALVQVLNPGSQDLVHAVAALRPHLEFVPLFFFGYAVMRSPKRLRGFLLLLCVVAAANGVAGAVQFELTPDQLAKWGPGYAERIYGTGPVSSRTFDDDGIARVRPLALGSDSGFGGAIAVLAAPALLTLVATARRRWTVFAGAPLAVGIILAILTSQSRSAVVAASVAVLAFLGLAVISQRRALPLFATAAAVALTVGVVSVLTADPQTSGFRYESITPSRVLGTTMDYRSGTLALIPEYATRFPLGAGLGLVGPAAGFGVQFDQARALNGESQFTFLLVELGVAGLLSFGALHVTLLPLATRLRRVPDRQLRLLLAGCAAPLFALAASWIAGPISATSPSAPYFWFTAGILAFWVARPAARGEAW